MKQGKNFETAAWTALIDNGLSVAQLAKDINYPAQTVSSVLSGRKKFRFVRAKIANRLKLPKSLISKGIS